LGSAAELDSKEFSCTLWMPKSGNHLSHLMAI